MKIMVSVCKSPSQLSLFARPAAQLAVPPVIDQALRQGGALALSISGGKDSHAMLAKVLPWFRAQGYPGRVFAIHADLGRAEWPQTPAFVEELARRYDVDLVLVRRQKGDLVARIEERLLKVQEAARRRREQLVSLWAEMGGVGPVPEVPAAPFWPSSDSRYCTSHLKGAPIDAALRKPAVFWPDADNRYCTSDQKRGPIDTSLRRCEVVISVEGVRHDESPDRATKPVVEIRPSITAKSTVPGRPNLAGMTPEAALKARKPGQRVALNWRPLAGWNTEEVWEACGTSVAELAQRQYKYATGQHAEALAGWMGHPAYVMGNTRLSCALCVFGSKGDLLNGAQANPQLYGHFIRLEIIGGSTFKNGWSLAELPVTGEAAREREAALSWKEVALAA